MGFMETVGFLALFGIVLSAAILLIEFSGDLVGQKLAAGEGLAGPGEKSCNGLTREAFERCVDLHCVVPPECEARCVRKADCTEQRCIRRIPRRGGTAAECAEKAEDRFVACRDRRCVPPPPDTCAGRCENHAAEELARCLEDDVDPAECEARARGILEACLNECGAAPEPTCRELCEGDALSQYQESIARRPNEDRATRRAQRTFKRCLRRCERAERKG